MVAQRKVSKTQQKRSYINRILFISIQNVEVQILGKVIYDTHAYKCNIVPSTKSLYKILKRKGLQVNTNMKTYIYE